MNRENRRRRNRQGSGCHKHKGPEGRTFAIAWACPDCAEDTFSDLVKDKDLTEQEITTGMRAALVCLGCARKLGREGWDFIDFKTPDHNRYMVFCPHEEDVCEECDEDD